MLKHLLSLCYQMSTVSQRSKRCKDDAEKARREQSILEATTRGRTLLRELFPRTTDERFTVPSAYEGNDAYTQAYLFACIYGHHSVATKECQLQVTTRS